MTICPAQGSVQASEWKVGFWGKEGESAPHAREGTWTPSCGEDPDCARRGRPGPPQCPDAGWGALHLT